MNQPWLQNCANPYITSKLHGLDHATVSSSNRIWPKCWDQEIVEDLFNISDQRSILAMSIGGEGEVDTLYWSETSSGEYSVKSAYQLIQKQKGNWHTDGKSNLWKLV